MILSVQQIKFEMLAYIKEFGGSFADWYVGVAAEPVRTLTEQHGLDPRLDIWLYKQALTARACGTIQSFFLRKLGTDGIDCPPAEDADCVYLYKKTHRTRP